MNGRNNDVLPEYLELLGTWKWLHRTWWGAHYTVGLAGVIAGSISGGLGSDLIFPGSPDYLAGLAGLICAICTSLVTFLGPLQRAERYWTAYHEAHQAVCEFRLQQVDARTLSVRMLQARRIILLGTGMMEHKDAETARKLASSAPGL